VQFERERDQLANARQRAEESFQIQSETKEIFPLSIEISSRPRNMSALAAADPSPSWTPKDLRQAVAQIDALARLTDREKLGENNDAEDEIAKDAFEKLLPTEYLFDHTPFISLLKVHYPI
jgi:hypothetical protein